MAEVDQRHGGQSPARRRPDHSGKYAVPLGHLPLPQGPGSCRRRGEVVRRVLAALAFRANGTLALWLSLMSTQHEVTQVAVIRHPGLGVLLLHSPARRWHFPDATLQDYEPWDQSL